MGHLASRGKIDTHEEYNSIMKTLLTQDYLRSGKTLHNLFQRYDIQNTVCEDLGVTVFNYRVLSPMEEAIVRETRGLILELDTWNVVCKPINAFFEPENPKGKDIFDAFDWNSSYAIPKYDGALVTLYHYKDKWHVGTRFVADGSWVVYTPNSQINEVTWRQLFELTLQNMGTHFDEFTSCLDPKVSYTFEQCSPENRVVCVYEGRHLWLVGAVETETLTELDIYSLEPFKNTYGSFVPAKMEISSLDDCIQLVERFNDPLDYEGFVAVDSNFNRLKIRNPKYTEIMRTSDLSDELSILSELRSIFVMNSTVATPIDLGNDLGGFSASEARVVNRPKANLQSVIHRILYLAKWVSENYDSIKTLSAEDRSSHPLMGIWPRAVELLDQGLAMSDVLGKTTEEEQIEALEKFESEIGNR
jgi:hypothetical protein